LLFMQLACKPGSVGILSSTREPGIPFHHLSGPVIAGGIIRPTPRHRTSSPQAPVYMVFQPIRCTASCVTTGTGELLPHLFTLIPTGSGRLFSVALLYPHGYLPVTDLLLWRTLGSRTPDPGTSKSFDLCEWVATSAKR